MYRQSKNNLLNADTCLRNMVNFGLLTAEICWRVYGNPANFNGFRVYGSVIVRHSSSGRQPNFAALNRGRHLYSAGRPSRWALAHILVCNLLHLISRLSTVRAAFDVERRSTMVFSVLPKPEIVFNNQTMVDRTIYCIKIE